jgi:hypothetical protein
MLSSAAANGNAATFCVGNIISNAWDLMVVCETTAENESTLMDNIINQ